MKKLFTTNAVAMTLLVMVLFIAGTGLILAVERLDADTTNLNDSQIVYLTEDPCGLE
jgi:hypothetical protein